VTTRTWNDLSRAMAAAALAVVIVLGSAFLWIGVPVLGFWLAGELTTTSQGYLFFVLPVVPVTMVAFGWLLYRLNAVYETLRGTEADDAPARSSWLGSLSGEREQMRRARVRRTLVDVAMTASAVTAMVLLVAWFFLFASAPLGPMQ